MTDAEFYVPEAIPATFKAPKMMYGDRAVENT